MSSRRTSRDNGFDDGSHIGILVRSTSVGQEPTLEKVNEEHSSDSDHGESRHADLRHASDTTSSFSFRAIRTTQEPNKRISIPKPKMDRCTQVTYDEIKAETKWVRPEGQVRQRRKFIRTETIQKSSSSSLETPVGVCLPKPLIPQIVYEGSQEVNQQAGSECFGYRSRTVIARGIRKQTAASASVYC